MPKAVSHSQVAVKGDTVWGITSQALERKLGRKPTNAEINAIVRNATVPSGDVNKIKPGERVKINFGPAAAPKKPPVTRDPKPGERPVTRDPKPRGPGTPNRPKPDESVTKPSKPRRKKPKPKKKQKVRLKQPVTRNTAQGMRRY